jgi:hypothetical protein
MTSLYASTPRALGCSCCADNASRSRDACADELARGLYNKRSGNLILFEELCPLGCNAV